MPHRRIKISQKATRALQQQIAKLLDEREQQRQHWSRDYPGGVHIGSANILDANTFGRLEGAQMLNHALVIRADPGGTIRIYALPLPK